MPSSSVYADPFPNGTVDRSEAVTSKLAGTQEVSYNRSQFTASGYDTSFKDYKPPGRPEGGFKEVGPPRESRGMGAQRPSRKFAKKEE